MVAAVATLDPETAANIVQVPMLECIRPPGSQDSHWLMAPYMRSAMPDRSSSSPSSTNSGIANRMKSVETPRSEEHTSELQSLMRNSYAACCLKKKTKKKQKKKK